MGKHGLKSLPAKGKLLDFGCGAGQFLAQMDQLGWQVTGIDSSAPTVEWLRQELALQVYVGSLPHPWLAGRTYDVITMWHSLEHTHNPRRILEAAGELLVPNGKLVVAVPNIDSLAFRWFGSYWYGLDVPRHLSHFSRQTLTNLLRRSGFQIESVRMVRHSSWLRASARLAWQGQQRCARSFLLQSHFLSGLLSRYNFRTGQAEALIVTAMREQ